MTERHTSRRKYLSTSGDIKNRKWSEEERRTLRRHAAKQAAGDDSDIDFEMAVSVRLEPRVLAWLKSKGAGHLTRINDILRNIMEAERRIEHR